MGNNSSKNSQEYRIYAATSWDYIGAGSDDSVSLEMIGEDGKSSGSALLDNKFEDNFVPGQTDVFDIEVKDVGLPLVLRFELTHGDAWACQDIVVKYRNEVARYPVHDWIDKEMAVTKAKALTFVQSKHPILRSMRIKEVRENKLRLPWVTKPTSKDIGWGLPRYVQDTEDGNIRGIFQPTNTKAKELVTTALETAYNQARMEIEKNLEALDSLEGYSRLYRHLNANSDPVFYERWNSDEEFGRQQMNGISPTSFSRCNGIPDSCQISNIHLTGILAEGRTLEEDIKAGKIYIADYSKVFQDVPRNKSADGEQLYCPDAVCLYYVNANENLVPVAIQLVPDDPETIFTPKDTKEDWMLAKMYFKVAMGNMHQWYYHFLLTHNVMEPFAVSLFRCLPRSHPVYKLLRPHLQSVTNINDGARKALIPSGSGANEALATAADAMVRKMFKDFTLEDLVIPNVLKKKGLDDMELLPKNYYRDDALELWKIIEEFVEMIIKNYYHSDQEVAKDEELQDFAHDLATEGFGWQDGNSRGVPESIETLEKLTGLITIVVFTCSVQHAAVNFGQLEIYKFIPNAPPAMRLPPHKKGEATMDRIMKSLPSLAMSLTIIQLVRLLSAFSPDEIYIGNYPEKLFDEPEVSMIMDNFKKNLRNFSTKVEARNENLDVPYEWLLPEKIPNSIAI